MEKSLREAVATSRHGSVCCGLSCCRQIAVDEVHERSDLLAHDLVGHEHDDRDRRQNQRVLGHCLTLAQPLLELTHLHICFRQNLHLLFSFGLGGFYTRVKCLQSLPSECFRCC